jgi:flagellar hook-associated protein 1
MEGFSIGISGLQAAQKAFDIIGNNIANAATEGYHRQRIELTPTYVSAKGKITSGGGVEINGVTRLIDELLESEIMRQESLLGQISQEYSTLRTVENAFGELVEGSGLSGAIDKFFNAIQDLSAHPTDVIWQNQLITEAEAMTGQFNKLGEYLVSLEEQLELEAENTVTQINILSTRIAELNDSIKQQEVTGGQANNLRDQRDKSITDLAKLVGIETKARDFGVIDVYVSGTPLVINTTSLDLEIGFKSTGELGLSVSGQSNFNITTEGGRLSGLTSLRNNLISDIHNELDTLASAMVKEINKIHTAGVGSTGSFTNLTGWPVSNQSLINMGSNVTDGTFYIRVTDTSTNTITRNAITVNKATDTLTSIAGLISGIGGLNASVVSTKLSIQADANYEFDFIPAVLPLPTATTLTGTSTVSVSGIYNGTTNDTFQFTVVGSGDVGNGTLQIEVRDGAAQLINTFNVGSGYAAGDILDVGNGIKIALSTGTLNNGETFDVDAFADTDTSGLLSAIGMNTLLSGGTAADMAVSSDIKANPGLVASSLGADMTDNTNALRMNALRDQAITDLNSMSPGEYYRQIVTDTGQELFVKEARKDNIESVIQNLNNQQGELSGVNINDEAAKILAFEQMFQALAKYMSTIQRSLQNIMQLI